MRYFRIFLLHFQEAFEFRGRSFIFFLLSFLNPLILLAYWIAVYHTKGQHLTGWSIASVSSYYLLLIIASAMLTSHIDYDVAVEEIQEGNLVRYLLRPFSYFWDHLLSEIGWRLIQGTFGIIAFVIFAFFLGSFVKITTDPVVICLALWICIQAYLLSYLSRMILAFSAFWLTDFRGLAEITDVITLVFAGFIMPLEFYPPLLRDLCNILPFAYSIYYPIIAFQGKLVLLQLFEVILVQLLWIGILGFIYQLLWKKGAYKFTGVGQ